MAYGFNNDKSKAPVQEQLVSGSNIKTINSQSILGSGNLEVSGGASAQTQGYWTYKVYSDGTFEAWYYATGQTLVITAASGNLYRSDLQTITLPTNMTSGKTVNIKHVSVNASHNNYPCWGMLASIQTPSANTFKYYAMSGGSRSSSPNYTITAEVVGTIF